MDITFNRIKALILSPWGRKVRAFEEPLSATADQKIPSGTSLPDLIRYYHGFVHILPFSARFGFLDRHNKERVYKPAEEDPFVFGKSQPSDFFKSSRELVTTLSTSWKNMGLPLIYDKDRAMDIPDVEKIWPIFSNKHKYHKHIIKNLPAIQFIVANLDVAKKFVLIRGVIPGWWCYSYKGKDSDHLSEFMPSIRAHATAMAKMRGTSKFKDVYNKVVNDMGDPILTSPGYPFFTANVDEQGNPTTRLETLDLFRSVGNRSYQWSQIVSAINDRAKSTPCANLPFLVAPLSRNMMGYKWNHVFTQSSTGLKTSYDERGCNVTRIAFMAPYVLNLYLSPLQAEWKAMRKVMPGMMHDGSAKNNRLKYVKDNNQYTIESDYSNYDRFLPINIFMMFSSLYLADHPRKAYWMEMLHHIFFKLPLVWPDYIPGATGKGWAFFPGKLGLLSGIKITSEVGTFVNSIICGHTWMTTNNKTEQDLVDYLCQYESTPVGTKQEHWWILGDDTLFLSQDLDVLYRTGEQFKKSVALAGLKFSLEPGDRFLMRSCFAGRDTPVPARIFQNTISNEEPEDDALKFAVGFAMRSDGMYGVKTIDAFNTGHIIPTTIAEIKFTLAVNQHLHDILSRASHPVSPVIELLLVLINMGQHMLKGTDALPESHFISYTGNQISRMNDLRNQVVKLMADRELKEALKKGRMDSFIYGLHANQHTPSSALLLSQILELAKSLAGPLAALAQKENTFYKYAMKTIGIEEKFR